MRCANVCIALFPLVTIGATNSVKWQRYGVDEAFAAVTRVFNFPIFVYLMRINVPQHKFRVMY